MKGAEYHNIEGHLIKLRVALTVFQTRHKNRNIRDENRKLYFSGFNKKLARYKDIKSAVSKYGTIAEISYLNSDSIGQASCFIVFEEQNIAQKLIGLRVQILPGIVGIFSVEYSPLVVNNEEM